MPLTNDIELNGVAFTVVPGAYKKGLRKPLAVSKPPARRISRTTFGPFTKGFGQAMADPGENQAGWSGVSVGPAFDGLGVEPFPNSTSFADAMVELPSATKRAYGLIAGTRAFIGIGQRLYQSVLLSNGVWSALTQASDLGAGFVISGLTYYLDDVLIMSSSGHDVRKYNTATAATSVWRAGVKAVYGVAYAGQLIYAALAANNQEQLSLTVTKWNGNAVTKTRFLDAPIINMSLYNGKVVIATRKSLYYMGGQPDPGEAKDPDITNDTGRPASWIGDPEPIMSHGVFTEGDDFTFLESYRGKLFTWLGGRVAEFDAAVGEGRWNRIGPEGLSCYGACVAGDWLIVAIASRYGTFEAWGFDGRGWWLLFQRSSAGPAVMWPVTLAGAGNRDALLFRNGGGTYDVLRLRWRSSALNTYPSAGTWTSGMIDGGDPSADKAWRGIGATFAQPEIRGNSASVDSVSFPLEYSIDGGATWLVAASIDSTNGAGRVFTREVNFPSPPVSRLLQVRQRWSSVGDWAPVLGGIWVESEDAEDYALGELAQAAYEADLTSEALLKRRWELTVSAGDRNVRRDGQVDPKTGRQAITALWDAWELGTELDFKDIDNDTDPVTYLVRIVGIEEKAARPADGARWGESTVALVIEESSGGVTQGSNHAHTLDSLSDVDTAGKLDGDVLTYESGSGQWVPRVGVGATGPAGPAGATGATGAAGAAGPTGPAGPSSAAVFSSVTPETITGVTVLTDFAQRYTIPANTAVVARDYRVTARGVASHAGATTQTLNFHLRLGNVTIASSGPQNMVAGASNQPWEVTFDLVVITIGAGGTAEAQGSRLHNATMAGMENTTAIAFDTTVAKTLGVAVTPSSIAMTVVQRQCIVQAL